MSSTKRAILIAKDCRLLSNQNHSNFGRNNIFCNDDQYNSINLNKYRAATSILHSDSINSSSKNIQSNNGFAKANHFENTHKDVTLQNKNLLSDVSGYRQNLLQEKEEYNWHASKNTCETNLNKSTLSLHIEAYENDTAKAAQSEHSGTKVVVDYLKASTCDQYIIPRRREEFMEAEVMAFKLSTRLMNSNKKLDKFCIPTQIQYRKKSDEIADSFHIIPMGKSDVSMQTRVSFLTKDMNDQKLLGIRGYSSVGFRLMDDTFLYGPIAAFPKTCLSWRVLTPDDITPESLMLFFMLQPKIDILVIGVGERKDMDEVRAKVAPVCKKHKIGLEIMPTEDAISTFNYLNSEMRYVAAALFPPRDLHVTDYQYGRALSYLQSWDEIDEHPLLAGLTQNLQNPAVDIVKRLWGGNHQPEIVLKIKEASKKCLEEKAEYIREGRRRKEKEEDSNFLPADDDSRKKFDDK